MTKINCAVVGMGIGEIHANFYKNYKSTNLIKIFEINKNKRKEIKKNFSDTELVNNENEIFKDPNVDLISIASYDNYHYRHIIKAIKYKKNIFVEKPICLSLKELKEIKRKIDKSKIFLSCNFVLRENLQFQKIEKIIKKKLGSIYFIEGDYNYGRLEKIETGWRGKIPNYSVSHGGAIHLIDLIMMYLKELPYKVYSEGNKLMVKNKKFKLNDFIIAILKFKSKKIVKISSNFGCVIPHHHSLKVFGKKGTIMHDIRGAIYTDSRKKNSFFSKFKLKTSRNNKIKVLKTFVDNIMLRRNTKLKENFNNIINSMLISLAIEKSILKNKSIYIDYKKLNLND